MLAAQVTHAYVANIISQCVVSLGLVTIQPTNGTIIWFDGGNITGNCTPIINEIEYLSIGLMEIIGSIYGISVLVGSLVILVMICYIITVWIERKSRKTRSIYNQIDI